jgi:hypothetical protein
MRLLSGNNRSEDSVTAVSPARAVPRLRELRIVRSFVRLARDRPPIGSPRTALAAREDPPPYESSGPSR